MILHALNTYCHGNGWGPVFQVTQSGRHSKPIKCTKIVPSERKLNVLQGTGLRIWIGPLVFTLFWNEIGKMSNFYKISIFSYFNIDLWRYFYTQICKTGYHSKACGIGRAMKVTASRLLNYTGHSGPKTEFRGQKSKIVSENRKSIFRSKQMPISVIMGPNESKKIGRYSGTKWLLHSVIIGQKLDGSVVRCLRMTACAV